MNCRLVLSRRSPFFHSRLFFSSQAKLRSTTHRCGMTLKVCNSLRLAICTLTFSFYHHYKNHAPSRSGLPPRYRHSLGDVVPLVPRRWSGGQLGGRRDVWLEGCGSIFVLSGFLIGTQLLRPMAAGQSLDLCRFYRRRAFRILPAFFVVFTLYALVPIWRETVGTQPPWQFPTLPSTCCSIAARTMRSRTPGRCASKNTSTWHPLAGRNLLKPVSDSQRHVSSGGRDMGRAAAATRFCVVLPICHHDVSWRCVAALRCRATVPALARRAQPSLPRNTGGRRAYS